MSEKIVKPQPQMPLSLDELTNKKKEIQDLLALTEDEYMRAQISENTYQEIKKKNQEKVNTIESQIQKLTGEETKEGAEEKIEEAAPETIPEKSRTTEQPAKQQPIVVQAAVPSVSKSEFAELKKKIDIDIGKANIELEKIKTLIDAQKDIRTTTEEKIQRLTESIGEMRSLVFQREGEFEKQKMRLQRVEETISDVKPEQYAKELQKRDKELISHEARLEKLEKIGSDVGRDVNEIKIIFKEIGSVENLVNVSKRINDRFIKMEDMLRAVERSSDKIEKLYVELNKRLEEFTEFKADQTRVDSLTKELMKTVDDINLKMGNFATSEELMKLKTISDSYAKDIEDLRKSVSTGLPFLGPLPPDVQELQKQKEEISTLIKSVDEEYKKRKISEEEYKKIKEGNVKKMAEIDKQIRESIERLKGIPQEPQPPEVSIEEPSKLEETPPSLPEPSSSKISPLTKKEKLTETKPLEVNIPAKPKSEKLISELRDLYEKGLISEKAFKKTKNILNK